MKLKPDRRNARKHDERNKAMIRQSLEEIGGFRQPYIIQGFFKGDNTSVWEAGWEGKNRLVGNAHPTQKPIELFARPMRNHTHPGEVCYEPFSGSGSQLVAAENLGRLCFANEQSPAFVAVALQRMVDAHGLEPRLVRQNGRQKTKAH